MLSTSDPQQTSPQLHQGAQIGQESQHISPQAPTGVDTFLPWDFPWIFKTVPYWLRETELSLSDSWILQNMMRLANPRVFWLPLQARKGDKTVLQFHAVGGSTEDGLSSPTVLCLKRCSRHRHLHLPPWQGLFHIQLCPQKKLQNKKTPFHRSLITPIWQKTTPLDTKLSWSNVLSYHRLAARSFRLFWVSDHL